MNSAPKKTKRKKKKKQKHNDKEAALIRKGQGRMPCHKSRRSYRLLRKRTATLCVPKADGDFLKFPVDEDRMNKICPSWPQFEILGRGERKVDIGDFNFGEQNANALKMVLEIVHGNQVLDYAGSNDVDPNFLFYVTEVHACLGHPKHTYRSDENPNMVGTPSAQTFPFFRLGAIASCIFKLVERAGYLYRVKDWLLLAVVADRLELNNVMQLVRNNLSLFCRSDTKEVPGKVRDSIKDREWSMIQQLNMMDENMLDMRKFYVDDIFKGFRLLSHQLLYLDGGILPNEEILDTYEAWKVAPCSYCLSISSEEFHQGLMAVHLWPLCAKSYRDCVIDLIHVIRDMEEKTIVGRHCNQLAHFYDHLRMLCKSSFDWREFGSVEGGPMDSMQTEPERDAVQN
ncbi:hypothetical protein F53441_6060 [Fusarium austroafricanum]|uniref:Uncharacterized protein n=1 Tax=Fusarium austroafricanum TaxID=2364996 RepID=A0A8H4KKJ2_9HYPO|nr:hypothetical protein F53441_6060 [Fusarium austroafricanum]